MMARLRRVLLAPTRANWLDAYRLILRRRRWRTVRLDISFRYQPDTREGLTAQRSAKSCARALF